MKTKIQTIAAICTIGFLGILNLNAVAESKSKSKSIANTDLVAENACIVTNDSAINMIASIESDKLFTTNKTDSPVEKVVSNQAFLNYSETTGSDLALEARLFTKWVVDQEEAKFVKKLNAKSEALIEAEECTKMVIDQLEAKFLENVLKQIEAGIIE
jgi:hypothetical protein